MRELPLSLNMFKNTKTRKHYKYLERITKGCANHRRIEIIYFLAENPDFSVLEIASGLGVNFKTISEHIRRLAIAGIVSKRSDGTSIRHALTPRGFLILKFLRTLE